MADLDFAYDLTLDEARRRTAVLEAIGDDWDPVAVLAEENEAYELLYSNLDDEQLPLALVEEPDRLPVRRPERAVPELRARPRTGPAAPGWNAPAASTAAPVPTARAAQTARLTGSTC